MTIRKFRLFRIKHGITIKELSQVSSLSEQRISELELNSSNPTDRLIQTLKDAFYDVIKKRCTSLDALDKDFELHKDSLLELVGVDYEL